MTVAGVLAAVNVAARMAIGQRAARAADERAANWPIARSRPARRSPASARRRARRSRRLARKRCSQARKAPRRRWPISRRGWRCSPTRSALPRDDRAYAASIAGSAARSSSTASASPRMCWRPATAARRGLRGASTCVTRHRRIDANIRARAFDSYVTAPRGRLERRRVQHRRPLGRRGQTARASSRSARRRQSRTLSEPLRFPLVRLDPAGQHHEPSRAAAVAAAQGRAQPTPPAQAPPPHASRAVLQPPHVPCRRERPQTQGAAPSR